MEKRSKPGKAPLAPRVVYGVVIAILCITAIVVGIVAAANRKDNPPVDNPPVSDGSGDNQPQNPPVSNPDENKPLSFISPVESGRIGTTHSEDLPVFSTTLGEWRLHSGIDIYTEEGAAVFASEGGTVSDIYKDALLGYTIEITHADGYKTVYSNLDGSVVNPVKVGDEVEAGDRIGTVGDSSISELADEVHLHFEITVNGNSVDPLKIIDKDEQKNALGVTE